MAKKAQQIRIFDRQITLSQAVDFVGTLTDLRESVGDILRGQNENLLEKIDITLEKVLDDFNNGGEIIEEDGDSTGVSV